MTRTSPPPFRVATGAAPDWRAACGACLAQLADLEAGASLGFVYASDPLADTLDLIVARLRAATGVQDWVGTGGVGVCTSGHEHMDEGAIVVLVAFLGSGEHRLFELPGTGALDAVPEIAGWCRRAGPCLGVVHGDPRQGDVAQALAQFAEATGAFLVGGLTSAQTSPIQIAQGSSEGGLSGVLLSAAVPVVTGLTQGCSPIGPVHQVTASQGAWILGLDGQPAIDVLRAEVGEVLARDLRRIGGYIHAALPIAASDRADYVVRNLIGIDARRDAIAVGDEFRGGDALMFVRRDGAAAQADLTRMLDDLLTRSEGRPVRGALYHSCIGRGPHLFGPDSAELRTIERALGAVPLVGFATNGEIFHDRLYGHAGVLSLFL